MGKYKRNCHRPSRYLTNDEDSDTPPPRQRPRNDDAQPSTSAPTPESNAANTQAIMSSLTAIQTQLGSGKEPTPLMSSNSRAIFIKRKSSRAEKNNPRQHPMRLQVRRIKVSVRTRAVIPTVSLSQILNLTCPTQLVWLCHM